MIFNRSGIGQPIDLSNQPKLGKGGEAIVYAVAGDPSRAAKIFKNLDPERTAKLRAMIANRPIERSNVPNHHTLAWPTELLFRPGEKEAAGYLMPRLSQSHPLFEFYTPVRRAKICPGFNYSYLVSAAKNLASAFAAIHAAGYVVGDVSENNIRVDERSLITVIDTDSFQVFTLRKIFLCKVGTGLYTPPELTVAGSFDRPRSEVHDRFGLAVLIFKLLMEGIHPFSGHNSRATSLEERIKLGDFPYSRNLKHAQPSKALDIGVLGDVVGDLMLRCFINGHHRPDERPSAEDWVTALTDFENRLISCSTNPNHKFHPKLQRCPWCAYAKRAGVDFFPNPTPKKIPVQTPKPAPTAKPIAPPVVRNVAPLVHPQPKPNPSFVDQMAGKAADWLLKKAWELTKRFAKPIALGVLGITVLTCVNRGFRRAPAPIPIQSPNEPTLAFTNSEIAPAPTPIRPTPAKKRHTKRRTPPHKPVPAKKRTPVSRPQTFTSPTRVPSSQPSAIPDGPLRG